MAQSARRRRRSLRHSPVLLLFPHAIVVYITQTSAQESLRGAQFDGVGGLCVLARCLLQQAVVGEQPLGGGRRLAPHRSVWARHRRAPSPNAPPPNRPQSKIIPERREAFTSTAHGVAWRNAPLRNCNVKWKYLACGPVSVSTSRT